MVRAPDSHSGGQRFKSSTAHHFLKLKKPLDKIPPKGFYDDDLNSSDRQIDRKRAALIYFALDLYAAAVLFDNSVSYC